MASSPQFAGTAKTSVAQFLNSDGTATKTVCTAGTNGSIIEALFSTSTDTTTRQIRLWLYNGTTNYLIDIVTIPAASTAIPVVHVPILSPGRWPWIDPNNPKLVLQSGWSLRAQMVSAVSTGKEINVVALFGDF